MNKLETKDFKIAIFSLVILFIIWLAWGIAINVADSTPDTDPPNDWELAYLHSPTNGLCFAIVMNGTTPKGVTQIDCINLPAGEWVQID